MCSLKTDKGSLRKAYLEKRKALNPERLDEFNLQICQRLMEFVSWEQVQTMHTYLPIPGKNEVDTLGIIEQVRTRFTYVRIVLPKVSEEDTLAHFYYDESTRLEPSIWGIPEPVNAPLTPINRIDLVLVPLLTFDKFGSRIGYGKGHYDRFLAQCRSETQKVGLSYFDPIERIDIESTDVPMDAVVTPGGVHQF